MSSPPVGLVRRKAFLFPLVAMLYIAFSSAGQSTGADLALAAATCVVSGGLWQLLHRRDLADRLTHLASGFTATCVFFLPIVWGDPLSSMDVALFGLLGIVTGLVYAEQFYRWYEWRAIRRRWTDADTVTGHGERRA